MSWVARISTNMQEVKFIFNPHVTAHNGATYVSPSWLSCFVLFVSHDQCLHQQQLQADQAAEPAPALHGARASRGHQVHDDLQIRYAIACGNGSLTLLDYGGRVERDITGFSAEEIKRELEKLVGLGTFIATVLRPIFSLQASTCSRLISIHGRRATSRTRTSSTTIQTTHTCITCNPLAAPLSSNRLIQRSCVVDTAFFLLRLSKYYFVDRSSTRLIPIA